MLLALFGRQLTNDSHSIPKGRDDAFIANQFKGERRSAYQSCFLSGPARGVAVVNKKWTHLEKGSESAYNPFHHGGGARHERDCRNSFYRDTFQNVPEKTTTRSMM
jgi:hypothetical protein